MIVGIDASAAVTPPRSGVGYHIVRLLEHLDALAPPDVEFRLFYPLSDGGSRRNAAATLPQSRRMRLAGVPFIDSRFATVHRAHRSIVFPYVIRRQRCDVFHGPAHVIPHVRGVRTVVTIHDLAFFDHDLYEASFSAALREYVKFSMARADAVIALSEHTKAHIERLSGRRDARVIYGAGNYAAESGGALDTDRKSLAGFGIVGPYVLYVGDFNPRKNIPYLVESFAELLKLGTVGPIQLVLAGNSQKSRAAIEEQTRALSLPPGSVVTTGRVPDDVLPILYRNASAFALCSLMEGFTLVTLEAMSYGVPVVATNTSSIAEGTGTAAELVPLDNAPAVARALALAIRPGTRRDEMRNGGLERVRLFTWENTARQTLALYHELA